MTDARTDRARSPTEVIGAARYERTESRTNERNGHRLRLLASQAGDIEWKNADLAICAH